MEEGNWRKDKGSVSAILYNSEKYKLIGVKAPFAFALLPEKPSKGWDAADYIARGSELMEVFADQKETEILIRL